jgi:NADH-quinone oxidoreductase subunit M
MVNHGLATGALFFLVGVIYERRHTRLINEFGGIAHVMPLFATVFMIVTLASIGLPGTNGFVGEFLILLGTFKANPVYAAIGTAGIVLAAVYMLWMVQRVFFGTCDNDENKELSDMNWREALIAFPIVIMIFWIGIYPRTFIDKIEPSVNKVIETVKSKAQTGDDSENATFESIDSDEIKPDEPGEEQWDSTGQ